MSDRFNLLSQQLFQKDFSDCTVGELQQLSQQYPFFAPVHFMLLKKLKQENSPAYEQQYQKAALYHHNPLTFDLLINEEEYDTDILLEPVAAPIELTDPSELVEPGEPVEILEPEELIEPIEPVEQGETVEHGETFETEAPITEPPVLNEQPLEATKSHVTEAPMEATLPAGEQPLTEPTSEVSPSTPRESELPLVETGGFDIMDVKEVEKLEPVTNIEQVPTPQPPPPPQPTLSNQALTFEPFHTVDYFASVGIKLSQEEISKDSFGRQLKSFTEWLKTMKRLPAAEQIRKLDPHAEEKVENIAAHSLDSTEVLTEAMAEVWVKQGKLEKAIEVYNKLSLQNPSKRAYFAAKLENLKKAI